MKAALRTCLLFLLIALVGVASVSAQSRGKNQTRPATESSEPRIKLLEIRRITGSWRWIQRSPGGGLAVLEASSEQFQPPDSLKSREVAVEEAIARLMHRGPDARGSVPTAILLVSLEDAAVGDRVDRKIFRQVENAAGHPNGTLTFELPKLPERNLWAKPTPHSSHAFLLGHISDLQELGSKLASDNVDDRRLALAALVKIRPDASNPYLLQAASSPDDTVRSPAIAEIRNRSETTVPLLRKETSLAKSPNSVLNELLLDLEYKAAIEEASAQGYSNFLGRYPKSAYDIEMRYRLLEAQGDQAALRKLSAGFPDKGVVHDVVDALAAGLIEVSFSGGGIQSVQARFRRTGGHPVAIRIPAGSYFVSSNPAAQNMVTTQEVVARIVSSGWQDVGAPAACANMPKAIPDGRVRFSVERLPPQAELPRVIALLNKETDFSIRQAAVWIVTDDASFVDLGNLVLNSTSGSSRRAINEDHVAAAMKIAHAAGIDLSKRKIWKDKAVVSSGVKSPQLRRWLDGLLSPASSPAQEVTEGRVR